MTDRHATLTRQAEARVRAGDTVAALALLKEALKANPNHYRTWIDFGRLLYAEGQFKAAVQVVEAAERFDPLVAEFSRIQGLIQSGRTAEAETTARQMLQSEPGHPRAVFTLASIAHGKGDHEGRVAILEEGLRHSPANLVFRDMIIGALEDSGEFRKALAAARHFAEIREDFASLWTLLNILFRFGAYEEALEVSMRAEALAAGDRVKLSEVCLLRGHIQRTLGHRDESVALFRRSIEHLPTGTAAWWGLADMKDYTFAESDKSQMAERADDPGLSPDQRSLAGFALAKAHETSGDAETAMRLYVDANTARGRTNFQPERYLAAVEQVISKLTADKFQSQAEPRPNAPTPIFIVGMPRSGSTLVEQILASHSGVEGSIEHLVLPSVKRRAHLHCVQKLGGEFLDQLGSVHPDTLVGLGETYLEESALFREGTARYFTDKLPYNFEHVGLIHKILPRAVIIDARRNPLDCGLSIFKQHFAQGAEYSYRLDHIGAYYNGYLRLMDHWDRVLPGRVIRVQYEELIKDPETEVRALLDDAGLPFEEACLKFYENRRAVRTASSEQVRQPIYTGSVGAWRKVDAHLGPLKNSLGRAALERFEGLFG